MSVPIKWANSVPCQYRKCRYGANPPVAAEPAIRHVGAIHELPLRLYPLAPELPYGTA
ncbi:MAG: hypothetical protein QMD05_08410 [Candidatus Brocadiaceae bacterium]|nr:hypothetical protein [Candidatus Brocadiaceae bacterium]